VVANVGAEEVMNVGVAANVGAEEVMNVAWRLMSEPKKS
jgi:hypothetical protein